MSREFPPLEARPWTTHAATTIVTPDDTIVIGARVIAEVEDPRMARLFAAAPDMLDALIQVRAVLSTARADYPADSTAAQILGLKMKLCSAVIDKARGVQR